MGRRNLVIKYKVWDNQDSTILTPSIKSVVDQVDNIKYVINIAPAVIGVLSVEFSDDKEGYPETWKPLDFKEPLVINGSVDTDYEILISDHVSHKLRLNIVSSSGSGLINAWYSASQVGA